MKRNPQEIRECVPKHVEYWKTAALPGYMGGPFGDRSGGMISFQANEKAEVEKIVDKDPFVIEELVEQKWIKEWALE